MQLVECTGHRDKCTENVRSRAIIWAAGAMSDKCVNCVATSRCGLEDNPHGEDEPYRRDEIQKNGERRKNRTAKLVSAGLQHRSVVITCGEKEWHLHSAITVYASRGSKNAGTAPDGEPSCERERARLEPEEPRERSARSRQGAGKWRENVVSPAQDARGYPYRGSEWEDAVVNVRLLFTVSFSKRLRRRALEMLRHDDGDMSRLNGQLHLECYL